MALMRVAQVSRAGGPFEIVERPIPEPGADSVRIRVQACGTAGRGRATSWPCSNRAAWATSASSTPRRWAPVRSASRGVRTRRRFARQLGATAFIDSLSQDPAAALNKLGGAKVILATATSGEAMSAVRGGIAVNGTMLVVGAAESMQVSPALLFMGCRSIKGWYSGTSIDSQDTLAFIVLAGVRPMNEAFPLERAAEAYDRMMSGKARSHVVLTLGEE